MFDEGEVVMTMRSQLFANLTKKMQQGPIRTINKNGIEVPGLTVFEDVILHNLDNLEMPALEINGNVLTYGEFFVEVEKYMASFKQMGLKEHDVVSLCLPVSVEFICSYFALTTMGVTCNALNLMFLLEHGARPYLDERCSKVLICYDKYYALLLQANAFRDSKVETIILTGDETYAHIVSDGDKVKPPRMRLPKTELITFTDFLLQDPSQTSLSAVDYNENRISTLTYTSGTTGVPKCIGHSDLSILFFTAAYKFIKRDEHRGDRTLLTIPQQHPTGLFYATVFQMMEGKTLVLEPRYDKRLFASDIKNLHINHAVQTKSFYAQLIQDRADGNLHSGDFESLRNAYSGGEPIPSSVYRQISETLVYAGCKSPLYLGYGRSEEGSLTMTPMPAQASDWKNTVGIPLPGIRAKLIDPETMEDLPLQAGARGEIVISTPVMPINHCYLGAYNRDGMPDGSFVDSEGVRWARPRDIAEYTVLSDGQHSYSVLGRADDCVHKEGNVYYLFDIKEQVSEIEGVQECEVLRIKAGQKSLITVHCVLSNQGAEQEEKIVQAIYQAVPAVDGIKVYTSFGINATSGKCDREAMAMERLDFYVCENGQILKKNL